MRANTNSRNGSTPDSAAVQAGGYFRDVWDRSKKSRTIIDASGVRTTFTFYDLSHTVMQSPDGNRFTLTSCPSQMTVGPAGLSHFAAHVELRMQPSSASANTPVGAFLGHDESQRLLTVAAVTALRTRSKCTRWLGDVIQQANLQLLDDLRQRKAIFDGDDPQRFVCWFRGTSRHAVIDAIKFCLRAFTAVGLASATGDISDPNTAEPADVAILRELARLAGEQIERIRETKLRQVMRDLRDGKSTRDSARRLAISKSKVGRMQKRGCRLIAARLGS